MPFALPDLRSAGETPPAYAARMKALEQEVQALLSAAQQERKALFDQGQVDTIFQVGDEVMPRTADGDRQAPTTLGIAQPWARQVRNEFQT